MWFYMYSIYYQDVLKAVEQLARCRESVKLQKE